MSAKITITQIKSTIGQSPKHRATMESLGLRKIGTSTERAVTNGLEGQLRKVAHLVKVER